MNKVAATIDARRMARAGTGSPADDIILSVRDVSKKFCKHLRRSMAYGIKDLACNLAGLKQDTTQLRRDEFWALEDVTLELGRGETLGIIGVNGSGKTTLLRLLAGIFPPDKGEIRVAGRVGALIALGAGFHPYMTGRENIYLNGAILGLSREEIDRKLDSIIEFSGVGDFIDAPISTYSSGMYVRLGFAIAISVEPDLLLVDEVLAVGDFQFRQKCHERINMLRERSSVVLVSHRMRDIMMLCTKAVLMERGRIVRQGRPEEIVEYYLSQSGTTEQEGHEGEDLPARTGAACGEMCHDTNSVDNVLHQWVDGDGKRASQFQHGTGACVEFSFRVLRKATRLVVGVSLWQNGAIVTGMSTDMQKVPLQAGEGDAISGRLHVERMVLNPGTYETVLTIADGKRHLYRGVVGRVSIMTMPVYFGVVTPKHEWRFDQV